MTDQPPTASGFAPTDEAEARLALKPGWRAAARAFPMRWPRPYLELAASAAGAPVRAMGAPDPAELDADPGDLADPVGDHARQVEPFVIRKHQDRAILLVTARCHFYCRFCFRRTYPAGSGEPSRAELDRALDYLCGEPNIREVILSGGDPLVLPDGRLGELLARLGGCDHIDTVRVHTRAPVHFPERVTAALADLLGSGEPLWLVAHFNHPVELTTAARRALATLRRAGVPLLNQAVLLRGVNDDPDVLAELCRGLYRERVKPYYLHHPDRAPGNVRFRLTIARGLELHRALRALLPGPALPEYVIDLPDGSGKVPVASLERTATGLYRRPGSRYEFADIPDRD